MKYKVFLYGILLSILFLASNNVQSQDWNLAGWVPNPGTHPSICVYDGSNVWIAGGPPDTPKVFKTSDGGSNWIQLPTVGMLKELYCVWVISPTVCFAGEGANLSGNAKLFRTVDDGMTWAQVMQTSSNDGFWNGIIFAKNSFARGTGIALAERIFKTSNNGTNWVMQQSGVVGVSNAHNSLMVVDWNFYGFGMNNGAARIRLTTNGGGSWSNHTVNLTGNYTSAIAFNDNKLIGVAATSTSMPYVSRTIDGGTIWTPINIGAGLTGNVFVKWIADMPVLYILGFNGGIKRSIDNGLTWTQMQIPPGVTNVYHFDFEKINNVIYGYAVSTNGTIIKLVDSVIIVTGLNNGQTKPPAEYNLDQNYPNPFNPVTTIKYSIPQTYKGKVSVNLSVFNILGENVSTLVNKEQNPGEYEIQFDGSSLASGMYFCRLRAGDEFSDVKKMMLIK